MPRNPRHYFPNVIYEVTSRTQMGRFAMRPCEDSTEILLGVIGRAQSLYPNVKIHAMSPLSNHLTDLISSDKPKQIPKFIGFIKSNLSKELKRLHKLRGRVFSRRAKVIPIATDAASIEARFRYVVAQGTKEDLIESPRHWPGANFAGALEHGEKLTGWWFDRTAEGRARARGEEFGKYQHATRYEVKLTPLPHWAEMTKGERQGRVTEIIDDITRQAEMRREGKPVLGAEAIMAYSPHYIPELMEKSPAPLVHGASKKARDAMGRVVRGFIAVFLAQSRTFLDDQSAEVEFPPFSFPPGRGMTPGDPPAALDFDFAPS